MNWLQRWCCEGMGILTSIEADTTSGEAPLPKRLSDGRFARWAHHLIDAALGLVLL